MLSVSISSSVSNTTVDTSQLNTRHITVYATSVVQHRLTPKSQPTHPNNLKQFMYTSFTEIHNFYYKKVENRRKRNYEETNKHGFIPSTC